MLLEAFICGVFGLIVGSFLNVVILREGSGRALGGRSSCMSCRAPLAWYDLVPVFSWMLLRGRCRECTSRISIQYPLVEMSTGILFAVIGFSVLPIALKVLGMLIVSLYIAITVYDLYHTIIPDVWSYMAAALALVYAFVGRTADQDVLTLLLGGPVAALPLFSLWAISKGRWMGLGDVKLALSIGWLLGLYLGLAAILGAFILGAVVSVCILLPFPYIVNTWRWIRAGFTRTPKVSLLAFLGIFPRYKSCMPNEEDSAFIPNGSKKTKTPLVYGFTMESEVPFGPFLIASCLLVWFLMLYGYDPLAFFVL